MNEIMKGIDAARLSAVAVDADGTMEGRYLFAEGFLGFGGHFPGFAILPAVVQVLTVVMLVGECGGRRQRLVAVQDAKFLNPVHPGQELLVRCKSRLVRGSLLHDAQISVGGVTAATMLLDLAPAGEAR